MGGLFDQLEEPFVTGVGHLTTFFTSSKSHSPNCFDALLEGEAYQHAQARELPNADPLAPWHSRMATSY